MHCLSRPPPSRSFPSISLCVHCLPSCHWAPGPGSIFTASIRYFYRWRGSPWAFSRMSSPSSVSLSGMSAAVNPLPSAWPFARLTPVAPCLSGSGEPRTGPNIMCVCVCVSHQFTVKGKGGCLQSAGNASLMQPQMLLALFCCKGAILADVQFCAWQDFQVLFCKAELQLVGLQSVMFPEDFFSQVQDFELPFVELHGNPVCSLQREVFNLHSAFKC